MTTCIGAVEHYVDLFYCCRKAAGPHSISIWLKLGTSWYFPGNPMVRYHAANAGGTGSIPGLGTKTPQWHIERPKPPRH